LGAPSFSVSGFPARGLLLLLQSRKRFSEKPFPEQDELGPGNEADAFANFH
jgi:hypothetical protein